MSMKPIEFDRRYGELDQVVSAYLGHPGDDEQRPAEPRSQGVPAAHLAHSPLGSVCRGAATARLRQQSARSAA